MISRSFAWKKASSATQVPIGRNCNRGKGFKAGPLEPRSNGAADAAANSKPTKPLDLTSIYSAIAQAEKQKRSRDRDFLVSVLSNAPTKRDAKQYLQTFGRVVSRGGANARGTEPGTPLPSFDAIQTNPLDDGTSAVRDSPRFIQGPRRDVASSDDGKPHVAVIKFCDPQAVDDATLGELAKTLAQLRALGLPSIIVVDLDLTAADPPTWLELAIHQSFRIARAMDSHGEPYTRVLEMTLAVTHHMETGRTPFTSNGIYVDLQEYLMEALEAGEVVVIPPYAVSTDKGEARLVSANDAILSLVRYLSGLQFSLVGRLPEARAGIRSKQARHASVDRVIVLDPLGGTPAIYRPDGAHVFLNLEEEYGLAEADINAIARLPRPLVEKLTGEHSVIAFQQRHKENLQLARDVLALLPTTASALLTTPTEAANLQPSEYQDSDSVDVFGHVGTVGTRRSQNPLIHNLLTDRPVYSSSLPMSRITPQTTGQGGSGFPGSSKTTLAKRGMPVTIFPDPRVGPWVPPAPGRPRLRLTDPCIDLPRLQHLIDDSFNRKLDVQHYLDRADGNIAGIIVAGEYEGGAVLTWEAPPGLDQETAYRTGRLVPYLDKFAVLKKSQGAGGVADIVFNAMVRDCFPEGVCWRSRKDNPVNKWYFERSRGTWKLDGTNWTMFWTTPIDGAGEEKIKDYEDVCRSVVPSWADNKIPD